jgi:hypothetical protein
MAEDSGTFKTNPRNSAQFGHFVMTRECPEPSGEEVQARLFGTDNERSSRHFAGNRSPRFAVFWIQPDSRRRRRLIQ